MAITGADNPQHGSYNPLTAEMVVGGITIIDGVQLGYSGDKGHGQTTTLAGNGIWVESPPRVEVTAAVHATSENIDRLISLWAESQTFDVNFSPSEDSGESEKAMIHCRVQDFDRDPVEIDSMPAITFNISGFDLE